MVPQNAFLVQGQYYYARVLAVNQVGFSLPQVSASAQRPIVVPGPSTSVTLSVLSSTELRVVFNPPVDDGGDAISSYLVEYSVRYFVRVSAVNCAGPGAFALTSPSSAAPVAQVPGKPHTIVAVSGSVSGSIAVMWHGIPCSGLLASPNDCPPMIGGGLPASDGGLAISEYAVCYNDLPDFSGLDNNNRTGLTTTANAYTIPGLTSGKLYFIRVLARNPQGSGPFCNHVERNCLVASTRAQAFALA